MTAHRRVIESLARDPWLNLAFEERRLRTLDEGEVVLMLWRNEPSVVIGRHQNPWLECRVDDLEADRVKLARRASGGGAVWHDPGNANFTFFARRRDYSVKRQMGVVVAALAALGVDARFEGRNDVLVGDRKVSGSAFFGTGDRWMHHGTLLIAADLDRLRRHLDPEPLEVETRAVRSVRSPVTNLTEHVPSLDAATANGALARAFAEEYGGGFTIERVDPAERLADDPALAAELDRHRSDAWRFGRTPRFTQTVAIDGRAVELEVVDGVVRRASPPVRGLVGRAYPVER